MCAFKPPFYFACLLVSIVTSPLLAAIDDLTNASVELDSGWHFHPSFGYYNVSQQDNWLYHEQLGWLYAWPEENGSMWWWSKDQGLCWSDFDDIYPYMYLDRLEGWLEVKQGKKAPDGSPLLYSPREGITASSTQLVPPAPPESGDFRAEGNSDQIELGRILYFDKILSGNRNISCATCHHPQHGSADGLSLPVGEGGTGLGPLRDTGEAANTPIHERVPRNAPAIWNLGASQFTEVFQDGRLAIDHSHPSGFVSPAKEQLPPGLESPAAAQAMFPVQSAAEMAGQVGENEVANAAAAGQLAGKDGVWDLLAQRLQAIPEYVQLFQAAYPHITDAKEISYVDAANAIGAFEEHVGRADNSPFDHYLRGQKSALDGDAFLGMWLFYGEAQCSQCHSGTFQTDHQYKSIALPQIGNGKGGGTDGYDDFGREHFTGKQSDRYKFRTPPLRNITLTAPYGHNGAFASLRDMVKHHLDPEGSLKRYKTSKAVLPARSDLREIDEAVMSDAKRVAAIAASSDLPEVNISDQEVDQLLAFLQALEDPSSLQLGYLIPDSVPSGLPVED